MILSQNLLWFVYRCEDGHGGTASQGRWRKGPGRMQTGLKREEEILREERGEAGPGGRAAEEEGAARAM